MALRNAKSAKISLKKVGSVKSHQLGFVFVIVVINRTY